MRNIFSFHPSYLFLPAAFFLSLASAVKTVPAHPQDNQNEKVIRNPRKGLWDHTGTATVTFRQVLTLGVDEGDPNQTFYKPHHVAIDQSGNIYILDSGNSRVQVFDSSGRFLRTFGKGGQGPGEFSSKTKFLVLDRNENLFYVFDYGNQRLTILDRNGDYKDSWPVQYMDDLVCEAQGTVLACVFLLQKDHASIHRYSRDGRLISAFGQIDDPGDNLIKMVNRSPYKENAIFALGRMANLVIDREGNIYYSQSNPYCIHKYNPQGKLLFKFTREVPFSTSIPLVIELFAQEVRKSVKGPYATVGEISILRNGLIAVPVFSPQNDNNFIDFYQPDGKFLFSASLPTTLDGPSSSVIATVFDHENNFYCFYGSRDTYPKLVKYAVTINLR